MSKEDPDRRTFLRQSSGLLLGAVVGGGTIARAHAQQRGFPMASDTVGKCVSCRFWGGVRRVSEDGKTITAESLGWCNNPQSMNYQKMTPPDLGPMKAWQKWEALG